MRPKIDWLLLDVCDRWDTAAQHAWTGDAAVVMDEHRAPDATLFGDSEPFGLSHGHSIIDHIEDAVRIRCTHSLKGRHALRER